MKWKRLIRSLNPLKFLRVQYNAFRKNHDNKGSPLTAAEITLVHKIENHIVFHLNSGIKRHISYARHRGMDYKELNNGFKHVFGRTFRNHRRYLRVSQAIVLIRAGYSPLEAAEILGYSRYIHFKRDFERIQNMLPDNFDQEVIDHIKN